MFGIDLDADDARSFVEQSRAVFSRVLASFIARIASQELSAKRFVLAYNASSRTGDELRDVVLRKYLAGSQLPHPERAFKVGEALGSADGELNPAGCNFHESSGLMMLIAAGYLQHAVLLLERASRDQDFDKVAVMEYLDSVFVLLEWADVGTLPDFQLPTAQRKLLCRAWDDVPKDSRFSRVTLEGDFGKCWVAVSNPTFKYFTKLAALHWHLGRVFGSIDVDTRLI